MRVCIAVSLCVLFAVPASAQPAPTHRVSGFDIGQNVVGAVIGFGNVGLATASIGGRFEHAIRRLPDLGNGVLGIGIDADYYGYSDRVFGSDVSFSYVPIGASANYHFKLDNPGWDPFLGVGLGYWIANISAGGQSVTGNSGLFLITRAGVRYFISERTAVQIDAGAGAASLNLGLMFRL